jgi:diguanylate cyclase (GGDEF)-like protein
MLARLGGDEFAVLLSNCTSEQAASASEKIRSAVQSFRFTWQGEEFHIGASIGRVDFGDGALSVAQLLMRADEMCYLAKTSGRNQIRTYSPPESGVAHGRVNLLGRRHAGGQSARR